MHILLKQSKFINLLMLLSVAIIVTSCDKTSDDLIIDETTEQYRLYDYYVDENGNEGIVALISPNKYIVVISTDEGFAFWGPMYEVVYNKDSISTLELNQISFSLTMLHYMNARGIERYPAQYWCNKKNMRKHPYGGSWMLPSRYLLYNIYGYNGLHIDALNKALLTVGGMPIVDDYYWTCTEDVNGYITIGGQTYDYDQANRAIITTPYNKTWSNKNHMVKKLKYRVRAVKILYYNN